MKISISFKTPDVLNYAMEDLGEEEKAEVEAVAKKWIKWGEYVTITLDTETGTATVEPV